MRYLGRQIVEQDAEVIATLMAGALGQWTDWTPTVDQGGAVTVTVTEAKYAIIGKVCHIYAYLTVTGTGTTANSIIIAGQPAAAQPALSGNFIVPGTGSVRDVGTANYFGFIRLVSATDFRLYDSNTRNFIGVDPALALAATDEIYFSATYRVA